MLMGRLKSFIALIALLAIATTADAQSNTLDGHEYVDLGLPSGTLWATCNVGATKPEDYGDCFAWGETAPKENYSWETYKWCKGSNQTLTKYCNNSEYGYEGFTDGLTTLWPEDDAAIANWGRGWRMPTPAEFSELSAQTTYEWTTLNGVAGLKFTAKDGSGNFIFLPAAGYRSGGYHNGKDDQGVYLSSSLYVMKTPDYASCKGFHSGASWTYWSREDGNSDRPVIKKSDLRIEINETNFRDETFRSYVKTNFDTNSNDYLSDDEIAAVTNIDVGNSSIKDLKGVEFFVGLKELYCQGNELTSINVSFNTELTRLACGNNQLQELDLSKNTKMENLHCGNNQLKELNVSNLPNLWRLYCAGNQLTTLNVTGNPKLTEFKCFINQLTSLDVSQNTELEVLVCYSNQLTSLDLSRHTKLTHLDCTDNSLTELDISGATALIALYSSRNQLTSLDVSQSTKLEELVCYSNQIKGVKMQVLVNSLPEVASGAFRVIDTKDSNEENVISKSQVDIAKEKNWKVYDNNSGYDYYVEYAGSEDPTGIEINETHFPDANFRSYLLEQSYGADGILTDAEIAKVTTMDVYGKSIVNLTGIEHFTALTNLRCGENKLTSLDVSKNTALEELYCYCNQLTSLNVSKCTALVTLDCQHNQLTKLDVSANTALVKLECKVNQLTKLDVSANTALRFLHCYDNQLTKLDVSANTALVALHCNHNQLTKLDVSANTALETLVCNSNQLTKLSVSQNRELIWLDCSGNQLSKLSVFDNAKLTTLDCDYNHLTELDVSENTKLVTLECCNNQLTSLAVLHCNKLTKLRCYGNQIKGDKMQALVVSLREVEGGEKGQFCVKDMIDENDGNEITTTQVGIAKSKSWEVMCVELQDNVELESASYGGSGPATNLTYEMKIEPGLTLITGEKILDYAALILTFMSEVYDVGDPSVLPINFKSKQTGETLMLFGEGMIWASADVSSADNVSFDITDEMRTALIREFEEDVLVGYDRVACSFVELLEKKDFILSLPKKVNTFEELNIFSEGAIEVAALYALQCWGELQMDKSGYSNASGKPLFDVDGAITLFDNVGPDDNIVHIITEQDRTDFMELAKMPFDYFVAYKSIQIRFGVEATKDFIYTFTKKETVLEEDSEAAAALMAVRSFAMDDLMPDYTCTVEKVGENPVTFTLKHKDKTLFAATTNDEGQDIVVVGDEVSAADNFVVSISNEMRGKMSEGCQELLAEYKTLQFRFEMGGSSGGGSTTYYSLVYTATEGGYIKGSINQSVKQGQSGTEVEAVANEGYRFVKWSDGLTTAKRIDTNVQKNISVTAEFEKTNTTGIFNSKFERLSVYPNPTQGAVQVEATGTVLVSNVASQLLQRVASQGQVLIDLSGYPDGIYFISVGNAVAKVVKR